MYLLFILFEGIFATIFVIERFGRKRTMAVQFAIFAVCIYFLLICSAEYVLSDPPDIMSLERLRDI